MLLPAIILDALMDDSASGIIFYTSDRELQEKISNDFRETFNENWSKGREALEEEVGLEPDPIECEILFPPTFDADSVTIRFYGLDMSVNDGTRAYTEFGCDALNDAVKEISEKYPDVRYRCAVQFAFCDTHCGDSVSYELPKDDKEIYPFVGDILAEAISSGFLADEMEFFWDGLGEDKEALLKMAEDYRQCLSDEEYNRLIQMIKGLELDE